MCHITFTYVSELTVAFRGERDVNEKLAKPLTTVQTRVQHLLVGIFKKSMGQFVATKPGAPDETS